MRPLAIAAVVVLAFGLSACAKVPSEEIESFKDDHPEEFTEYVAPELAAQQKKFALFRSYSMTREIMLRVEAGGSPDGISESGLNWRTVKMHGMPGGVTCYTYTDAISCVKN